MAQLDLSVNLTEFIFCYFKLALFEHGGQVVAGIKRKNARDLGAKGGWAARGPDGRGGDHLRLAAGDPPQVVLKLYRWSGVDVNKG